MNQSSSRIFQQASAQLPFGLKTIMIAGGSLMLYGLTRRSKPGLALATAGGLLAWQAARSRPDDQQRTRATFLINATAQQAYDFWRDFENLPRFMVHLKSVRKIDERSSEWTALGPLNHEVRWKAETTEDRPAQRIAWRSSPESDIRTSGFVEFRHDPQDRGTFVTAEVNYSSIGGSLGRGLAALIGKHPEFMVREDLRRFKALLEAGEAPTIRGQSHGPRGIHGHTEQVLFREKTNHPEPQAATSYAHTTL